MHCLGQRISSFRGFVLGLPNTKVHEVKRPPYAEYMYGLENNRRVSKDTLDSLLCDKPRQKPFISWCLCANSGFPFKDLVFLNLTHEKLTALEFHEMASL